MTNTQLPVNATLEDAKKLLRENWHVGLDCPACTQYVKKYERKLNTGITLFLIGLYRIDPEGINYHHAKEVLERIGAFTTSRDYSILEYWKLIEPELNTDEEKRTSGYWKITQLGRDFVEGKETVLSHAQIFNNKGYGLVGAPIDIRTALGNKFNYEELMQS